MLKKFTSVGFSAFWLCTNTLGETPRSYDLVIYGGTASGVVAAVQAGQMNKTAVIIEPSGHLGGLTTGGLGATDIGNKAAIGGISRDFYKRLGKHYGEPETWKFEPHVAEAIINEMARESKATVLMSQRLRSIQMDGAKIVSLTTHNGETLIGKMFIDATYEGDLMAAAKVSYTVGREANAQYGETLDGVQLGSKTHQFEVDVDPYVQEGDASSGLLPRIHEGGPGEQGQGDKRVQAYCFRMCLTQNKANLVPFPKPADYDPKQYELLARYLQKAEAAGKTVRIMHNVPVANGKTDTNNDGAFSTDNIGMNYDFPEGDWDTRHRIYSEHASYQKGLMWCLANDPRIPERVRQEVSTWGLAKDEFIDNGHWPQQLYIREARRMVSDVVMTQKYCEHKETAGDPVGLGAYNMDSHNCQRYAKGGKVFNEGDVQVAPAAPYGISYRSIVPKKTECTNLLVPICLSSSHIAYGSIRMEPVFMILGQSAATAAAMAIDAHVPVQQVSYARLSERLMADGQVLKWIGPGRASKASSHAPLAGAIDDTLAKLTGAWEPSTSVAGYVGDHYLHDGNKEKGSKSVRFPLQVHHAGTYRLHLTDLPNPNRATNVPVTVHHAGGEAKLTVNQRAGKTDNSGHLLLGDYPFDPAQDAWVEISNRGTDGYVIADAVQLLPAE